MKSLRKMLARSFTKVAKRWEDSKETADNLRRHGFKDARAWGRAVALSYEVERGHLALCDGLLEVIETAAKEDRPVTQDDIDEFVDMEISYW